MSRFFLGQLTRVFICKSSIRTFLQVSYVKAIDVWMGTCLAFVFGVMIEFTLVNYLSRRKREISCIPIRESRHWSSYSATADPEESYDSAVKENCRVA